MENYKKNTEDTENTENTGNTEITENTGNTENTEIWGWSCYVLREASSWASNRVFTFSYLRLEFEGGCFVWVSSS